MASAKRRVSLLDLLRRKSNPSKPARKKAASARKPKSAVPASFRAQMGKQSAGFKQYRTLRKQAAAMGLRFKRGATPNLAALKEIVKKGPSGIVSCSATKSNPRRPARRPLVGRRPARRR